MNIFFVVVVFSYILSAPNILKVGSPEKVFVEAQDYSGASLNVKISVRSPKDNREVTSASVTLTPAKNYQDLVEIKVRRSTQIKCFWEQVVKNV